MRCVVRFMPRKRSNILLYDTIECHIALYGALYGKAGHNSLYCRSWQGETSTVRSGTGRGAHPSSGVMPMLVSTLFPPLMQHMLLPEPVYQCASPQLPDQHLRSRLNNKHAYRQETWKL